FGPLAARPFRGLSQPGPGNDSGQRACHFPDRPARRHLQRVYATAGYDQSSANLSQVSLASDLVFGDDGGVHELGTISGSLAGGLIVDLAVGVQTA
ncbi:MAG TPA: hypothetical protein VIB99_01155, partial [Candidatus Limnocylindrales bacterium]